MFAQMQFRFTIPESPQVESALAHNGDEPAAVIEDTAAAPLRDQIGGRKEALIDRMAGAILKDARLHFLGEDAFAQRRVDDEHAIGDAFRDGDEAGAIGESEMAVKMSAQEEIEGPVRE